MYLGSRRDTQVNWSGVCPNQAATPVTLRMQALTAARFDDILAHATFIYRTGTGSKDSRLYPLWDQTWVWDPGD